MGILQKMETDGVVKAVQRGGFISPFGYECINTDNTSYGAVTGCKTYAIKRYIADNYLVQAAARLPTVDFFPGMEVTEVVFTENIGDSEAQLTGYNTVRVLGIAGMNFYGKICLVCDGSTSYLAQKLGIIEKGTQPQAVCSHAYIRGNSHNWQGSKSADGVMVFNKAVLPGYSALFRHYNDDVYLGK